MFHVIHQIVLAKFWCAGLVFLANSLTSAVLSQNFNNCQIAKTCTLEFSLQYLVYYMVHLLLGKGLGSLHLTALSNSDVN